MRITRRTFVKGSLATTAVVAGTSAGCGNDVNAAPIVETSVQADSTASHYGEIIVPVPRYPALAKVGGAVTLKLAALPAGTYPFAVPPKGVLLVNRGPEGDPTAFIATRADCPHQGCSLGYSASDRQIECPCHGSRFLAIADVDAGAKSCVGLVTHLPARDNLTVYATTVDGDFVFVDLKTDVSCGTSPSFPAVVGGTITMPITDFPALADVGGSVVGKPSGLADTLIVARVATDKLVVLSAICTHQGCTIQLDEKNMRMDCPCHGSEYAFDGTVIEGPAPRAVKAYSVTFDGTTGVISTT